MKSLRRHRWLRTGHRPVLAQLRRPSPAMIVALIALFVSLSGVSYGVATGFIDSREIKNNEVRSIDIRNNEVRTRDLRNNEVRGIDIRNSTVQGRDIQLNTVTGEDVKEDTLQKVPSALLADTATKADSADTVSTQRVVDETMSKGAADKLLITHGPLTLYARCANGSGGNTDAALVLKTSESGANGGDQDSTVSNKSASGVGFEFALKSDAPGTAPTAGVSVLWANVPSGPALTGQVLVQGEAATATTGTCRLHGVLFLQG